MSGYGSNPNWLKCKECSIGAQETFTQCILHKRLSSSFQTNLYQLNLLKVIGWSCNAQNAFVISS